MQIALFADFGDAHSDHVVKGGKLNGRLEKEYQNALRAQLVNHYFGVELVLYFNEYKHIFDGGLLVKDFNDGHNDVPNQHFLL